MDTIGLWAFVGVGIYFLGLFAWSWFLGELFRHPDLDSN